MLVIFAGCLLDVFGGMALAALAAWVGWQAFRWLRWPEAGPWVIVVTLILIPGALHRSLLQMAILFLVLIALGLVPVGRAWRRRDRLRRLFHRHNVEVVRRGFGNRRPPRHLV